jgi:hypothetical protein
MRVCYLHCHEAGLCCYLVINMENVLRVHLLQLFYFHLWIYLLTLPRIYLRSTLILSFYLCLGLPSGPFPSQLLGNGMYALIFSPVPATCILFDFIISIIFGTDKIGRGVRTCSNTGIEVWIFVCLYSVFVLSCVDSDLASGWYPVQGVLPNACKIHNFREETRSSEDGLCYKPEGRGFDSRWGHWIIQLA